MGRRPWVFVGPAQPAPKPAQRSSAAPPPGRPAPKPSAATQLRPAAARPSQGRAREQGPERTAPLPREQGHVREQSRIPAAPRLAAPIRARPALAPAQKPRSGGRKFAFVTVLWAPGTGKVEEYVMNALCLGCSLQQTKTQHDLVLLATPDLLGHPSARALSTFWDVRPQEHVDVTLETRCAPRFQRVFTKLSVMKLTEYEKVVLLDADMLVLRNVDEIFGFRAPAGFMRGWRDYRPEVRPPETYRFWLTLPLSLHFLLHLPKPAEFLCPGKQKQKEPGQKKSSTWRTSWEGSEKSDEGKRKVVLAT